MRMCVLVLSTLFSIQIGMGQNEIKISTIITPPHSPYLSSYINNPNKALISVVNTSGAVQNLRFVLSIVGDNGISFTTSSTYKPSSPLTIQPGQQRMMNSSNTELKDYFSTNTMTLVGISKSDLIQNDALPEGNYEICLRALDYNTGAPLSDEAPQGCAQISISYVDPPLVIQPQCGEDYVASFPQNLIFTWSPPASSPAGINYLFTLKEVPSAAKMQLSTSNQLNPNDVIKNAAYPVLYSGTVKTNTLIYNNAMPILTAGKSYVWRVQAKSTSNLLKFKQDGYTEACVLNYTPSKFIETNNQIIKLIEPKDKIEVKGPTNDPGKGILFSWENFMNSKFAYEVNIVKLNANQTPKEAFQKNPLAINDEKGGKYKAPYLMNYYLAPGSYAWKVVYADLDNPKNRPESEIRTFAIAQEDTASVSKFSICNNDIIVTKTTNNTLNMFSGEGYVMYLKMHKIPVKFESIKLAHTSMVNSKKSMWKCYEGLVQGEIKNIVQSLEPQGDLEGVFNYTPKHLSYEAKITPSFDAVSSVFKIEEGDKGEGHTTKIYAELEWISPIQIKEGSTLGGSPIPMNKGGGKYTAAFTLFSRKISAYQNEGFQFNYDTKLVLAYPEDIVLNFDKESYLSVVGDKVYGNFSGNYSVYSGTKLLGLMPIHHKFKFTYATGMLIKGYPADGNPIKIFWDKNKTVSSEFMESYLRLGESKPYEALSAKRGVFIYPNFKIQYLKDKFVDLSMTYMYNTGKGYEISKNKPVNTIALSKFKAETDKLKIQIYASKLAVMDLKGSLIVPFVNMKAPFSIYADYDNKPSFDMKFDSKETSTVIDNATQKVVVTPIAAKMESENEIRFSGDFDFIDKTNGNADGNTQTFSAEKVRMKNIIIRSDNSIESLSLYNPFDWQTSGLYNGFDFKMSSYRCMTKNGKPTIKLTGDMVLEEGSIAPLGKSVVEIAMNPLPYPKRSLDYYTTSASAEKIIFMPPDNDVQITSTGFKAKSVNNGCTDFEVLFEYKNDAVYGKGFLAQADVWFKEPMQGSVHTKVMVGKAKEGYKYWFVEASQQDLITTPTGLLDLVAYGFGGRVYYHMWHKYGSDIDASNYIPNKGTLYGVYGNVKLKTDGTDGRVLWGSLSTEITTMSGGGLYPIKIKGIAHVLTDGVENTEAMAHGTADLEIGVSNPRYISGIITVDANVYDMVQAHGDITMQFGDGLWYLHMGTKSNPMSAYVPAIDKSMNGYMTIDKVGSNFKLGAGVNGSIFGVDWSGKKCVWRGTCCATAHAYVHVDGALDGTLNIPLVGVGGSLKDFQVGGSVGLYASAGIGASLCGIGKSASVAGGLTGSFETPNPFCVAGSLFIETPWWAPNISVGARIKNGVPAFQGDCN